jgi:hypothetical protein
MYALQTQLYNFELVMTLLFLVLFALTAAPSADGSPSSLELSIQNNFNFILFSTLSGLALVCSLLCSFEWQVGAPPHRPDDNSKSGI